MLSIALGFSQNQSTDIAISEAWNQIASQFASTKAEVLLVFTAHQKLDQQRILNRLKKPSLETQIIGASTGGIFAPKNTTLAVIAMTTKNNAIGSGVANNITADANNAGKSMGQFIAKKHYNKYPQIALVFPDGSSGNIDQLLQALAQSFNNKTHIYGASSGSETATFQTNQFYDKQVVTNSIVGLGFFEQITCLSAVSQGFQPYSVARTITKSQGNTILELDNQPAANIYLDNFTTQKIPLNNPSQLTSWLKDYPLGVLDKGSNLHSAFSPISIHQNRLICPVTTPNNSQVQLLLGTTKTILEETKKKVSQLKQEIGNKKILLGLIFTDISRKNIFLDNPQVEINLLKNELGNQIPLIGLYTYGQIFPQLNLNNQPHFTTSSTLFILITE